MSIETLIRLAGGRELPTAEGMERARRAAAESWRRGLAQAPPRAVRTRRRVWLACAAAIVLVLTFHLVRRETAVQPVIVAHVSALEGVASLADADAARAVRLDSSVRAGDTLSAWGRVAASIAGGLSLRLDRGARVTFSAADRVTLRAGTVYVDSGGLNAGPPLTIVTPAGEVTHVGTQFLVSVSADSTHVRVREGRVQFKASVGGAVSAIAAGDELDIRAGSSTLRHGAPAFGPAWDWQADVAPVLTVEDRPLAEFLAWLVRERGWQLRYADAALQQRAHEIRLHGSLAGLDTPAMLERVSLVTGLALDARDGVLSVGP
jgi:ferric-dicitrate binding protein FerR (iron transport regulator)